MPPILCGCGLFMQVTKNGITVEELTETGESYRLWDADLWVCEACGHEVASGYGRLPLAEHWQPHFEASRVRLAPLRQGRYRLG